MRYPLPVLGLVCFLGGCGRNVAPQTTKPVVISTTDTIFIAPDNVIGEDCSQYATLLNNAHAALTKCNADINGLLAENTGLRDDLAKSGKRVKVKNSYNTDNSQVISLKNSNQMLAQDNARLKADSAVMADKLKAKPKEVVKNNGNTKEGKDRFWLGVLVAVGVFQGLRIAKKHLPPPFNAILNFIA